MRIRDIRAIGLAGATPKGGWSEELRPEYTVHTLIVVRTEDGVTGTGSVFTNADLVRGALAVMEPLFRGENALEPERVSEKLHQHTFWLGRGGSLTHTISGIDIALWDILGQGDGPAGRSPPRGPLSRAGAALCVAADGPTGAAARATAPDRGTRLPRVQDRLGTVWPREPRAR